MLLILKKLVAKRTTPVNDLVNLITIFPEPNDVASDM